MPQLIASSIKIHVASPSSCCSQGGLAWFKMCLSRVTPRARRQNLMRRLTSVTTAIVVGGLTGCDTGAGGAVASRPLVSVTAPAVPAAPSVVASGCSTWMTAPGSAAGLVHIRTAIQVRHAQAPQAGVRGLVTVSSIDVAFISGGAQVGWATQATPQGDAPMVIGNGNTELTAVANTIYLSGRWAPHCQVQRVYWLPGDHS